MEIEKKVGNPVLGFIGALLGALIGSVLWIVLDQVGFIASIAAYAIIYCSIYGYTLLGKELTKNAIILSVVMTVLAVLVADYVSLAITLYQEVGAGYDITFIDVLFATVRFFAYEDVLRQFLINLLVGYVFVALGCFRYVKALLNNLNKASDDDFNTMAPAYVNAEIEETEEDIFEEN